MIEAAPAPGAPDAMRIRSEPFDPGPRRFVPALLDDAPPPLDLARFDRLADAIAVALSSLAGQPVTAAVLGWGTAAWASDAQPVTRISEALAAAFTAIRFGGTVDTAGGSTGAANGVATGGMTTRLAAAIDALAMCHWPAGEGGGGLDLELTLAKVPHAVWVAAPPRPAAATPLRPSLAGVMLDQPFRISLAVSTEMIEIARLLPFVAGTVWPIAPQPAAPLAIGGQRVALVRIEPTPDGRQQAVVVGGLTARREKRA